MLNKFDDGATHVDEAALRERGLANGRLKLVKILGDGELTRKLTVHAHAFSASARAKIEKLGGACQLIESKPPAKPEGKEPVKPAAKPAE